VILARALTEPPDALLQFDSISLDPTEDGGVVHLNASIQQHEFEIPVADRKHQIPPDPLRWYLTCFAGGTLTSLRPQDHLGGELPAFEGLIPRYLDRLSTLAHPRHLPDQIGDAKLQQNRIREYLGKPPTSQPICQRRMKVKTAASYPHPFCEAR